MDTIKSLYTTTATATGGRNGHCETENGSLKVDLSLPAAMGGSEKPNTTTPEDLFAAGYAACFGGALDYVAKEQGKDASKASVACSVSVGPRDAGGFGLAVKLQIDDKQLSHADLTTLATEAHEKICPYSHATRGNVEVLLEVHGVK